jgi:NADPH:quinone reductase-like Zn-dependent oxidoreductase
MNATMNAAVYTQYGTPDVLQVQTIARPVPKGREILIKVHATAATSGDCRLRKADPFGVRLFFGLFKPRLSVLGGVFSGEIEAIGPDVTRFSVGDAVFGSTTMTFGAYAEYLCLPETGPVALKPASLTHPEAAALPFGGATAWQFLQKANVQAGQKVLIYGASGAIGTAAVQIAQYLGAEVTAVCSTANRDWVQVLGADHVIDYTQTDFSTSGSQYDVVYETVNKAPVAACAAVLKKGGKLVLGAAMLRETWQGFWAARKRGAQLIAGPITPRAADIEMLAKMAESGHLRAVIDQQFPLHRIADAHRYVEQGHKKGNVVVFVIPGTVR